MSNRINYITVVLEEDKREDDCEQTLNAIRNIKGVLSVEANVAAPSEYVAEERCRQKLAEKIWDVLFPRVKI